MENKNVLLLTLTLSLAACSSEGVVPIKYDAELDPTARRGFVTTDVAPPDATVPDTLPPTDTLLTQEAAVDTKAPPNVAAEPAQDALPPSDTLPSPDTIVAPDTLLLIPDTYVAPKDTFVATDTKPDVIVDLNIQPVSTTPLTPVAQGNFCWPYGKSEGIRGEDPSQCAQFGYCAFVQSEVTGCKRACIGNKGRILPMAERIERECTTEGIVGKAVGCQIDEICGKDIANKLVCKRIHCKILGVTNVECPQGVWCLPSLSDLGGTCSTSTKEAGLVRVSAGTCT